MEKLDPRRPVTVPLMQLPVYRTTYAIQCGVERKILVRTWGGIGDQICAEPTLRHMINKFKDCEIFLASEIPELFDHLSFKRVFDLKDVTPNYKNYLVFETITSPDDSNLVWQFFSHMLVNCVDFPSLCAIRSQLPVEEKQIILHGTAPNLSITDINTIYNGVAVHPGKHWQSKTFPKEFWDRVLAGLRSRGLTPILIGGDADDNRGTVKVNTEGCLDLRNKTSIKESIWICQNVAVLLTNDSSPLHMAASGDAHIGYIATCKHPDMITHWRNGVWQWRERNFGLGGVWDVVDYCPNKKQDVETEFVDPKLLLSWLPDPSSMAMWAEERVNEMRTLRRIANA